MYLDSAIIVKLLVREPDSDWFNTNLSGHALNTSELALTEVQSALFAKERAGFISKLEREKATVRFEELLDDEVIELFPLNNRVLERATVILKACHPRIALRTLDALHVATCDLHNFKALCATDQRMRAACEQLAIGLFPERIEDVLTRS